MKYGIKNKERCIVHARNNRLKNVQINSKRVFRYSVLELEKFRNRTQNYTFIFRKKF